MKKKKVDIPLNWPLGVDLKPLPKNRVMKFTNQFWVLKDFRETLPKKIC